MTSTRPHWSYSAINQYLRCPLQYYFERILRIPRASVSSSLALGSAVHKSLAVYHLGLQQGVTLDAERIKQAFLDGWRSIEEVDAVSFKADESRSKVLEQGISLVEAYLMKVRLKEYFQLNAPTSRPF